MITLKIVLSISLLLNVIVFVLDTVPYLLPKIERKLHILKKNRRDGHTLEKTILRGSLELIKKKNSEMIWEDQKSFTESVFSFRLKKYTVKNRTNNFPRAFLLYGLTEYIIKTNDVNNLNKIKNNFEKLVNIRIDKVDQAPFGIVALNLYDVYKDSKYLLFANSIFAFIKERADKNCGIVLYRDNQNILFYDTIGMIVPFLSRYSRISNCDEALKIATNQLEFYYRYGVDKETHIPVHAINLEFKLKIGSTNWGRGIGWYLIGLNEVKRTNDFFRNEYKALSEVLIKLRNADGFWSQFLGSSEFFDASTTTMFLYCLGHRGYSKEDLLMKLDKYISIDGHILHSSGDTYGANYYSRTFGKSEFSQGMLLLTLCKYYE